MHALVTLLFFLAQPFWETKPAEDWTLKEIDTMRWHSPWAQTAGPAPNVVGYLATAVPIEEAESELRVRSKGLMREVDPDYAAYITRHREENLVLAVPYSSLARFGKPEELRKLENESVMLIGKNRPHKLVGHFPPTPADPILRLVFPREVKPTDKSVVFRVYLPGINFPERELEFEVRDLIYHGKLEM